MRLQKTYVLDYLKVHFEFTPYYKFNFIKDSSATGKTYLFNIITRQYPRLTDFLPLVNVLDKLNTKLDAVLVADEDQLDIISNIGWETLRVSPNIFLIISRSIPPQLSIHYKAIYCLKSKDSNYRLEPIYKRRRLHDF